MAADLGPRADDGAVAGPSRPAVPGETSNEREPNVMKEHQLIIFSFLNPQTHNMKHISNLSQVLNREILREILEIYRNGSASNISKPLNSCFRQGNFFGMSIPISDFV